MLVVDDSPFVCRLLSRHLSAEPDLEVAGSAHDGDRALALILQLEPDIVTLDLEMPGRHGLEVLDEIMKRRPTPVVVVSGASKLSAERTRRALELGAVDFVLKYSPSERVDPDELRRELVAKVRASARVKVVRSLRSLPVRPLPLDLMLEPVKRVPDLPSAEYGLRDSKLPPAEDGLRNPGLALAGVAGVVVIGASTGGPLALRELLARIPASFPSPIVVVQHLPASFTSVMADHLDQKVNLSVREARDGDRLEAGLVLVAPGGRHLLLRSDGRVALNDGPEIGGHKPAIDVTMQSAAQVFGTRATGVVLTGMGSDGTQGLVAIRTRGGRTFAQEPASCVVSGMPERALEKGVVDRVGKPADLGRLLVGEAR